MKKQGVWELFVAKVDARTGEVRKRRDVSETKNGYGRGNCTWR